MSSIQYDMTSIILWDYVHTSWYEHWAWFYMEHYILCASMYMCTTLHYACQVACPRGSHQFSFSLCFARLMSTRELGAYCPQYVLTVFLFAGFRSVRYVFQLCGPMGQSCIPAFYLQFMCIALLWMQPISNYIQYKFSKFLPVSIFLWFSYSYFFLPYYLLSFVANLVLFTIPSPSRGVPDVGPINNGL